MEFEQNTWPQYQHETIFRMTEAVLNKLPNAEVVAEFPELLIPTVAAHDQTVEDGGCLNPKKLENMLKENVCRTWDFAEDQVDTVLSEARIAICALKGVAGTYRDFIENFFVSDKELN